MKKTEEIGKKTWESKKENEAKEKNEENSCREKDKRTNTKMMVRKILMKKEKQH